MNLKLCKTVDSSMSAGCHVQCHLEDKASTLTQLWTVKALGQMPTSTSGEGFPGVACVHLLPGYVVWEKGEEHSLIFLFIETLISTS